MEQSRLQFHLEEYKSVRQEIDAKIKESVTFAQYALLGSAAVVSWLATASSNKINPLLYALAWWVPLMLCAFASLRAFGVITRIMLMSRYLQKIEEQLAREDIGGWEHFINAQRRNTAYAKVNTVISIVFWLVLVSAAVAVGYIGYTSSMATVAESSAPK